MTCGVKIVGFGWIETKTLPQILPNDSLTSLLKNLCLHEKKSKKFTTKQTVRVKVKPVTKRDRHPDRTKFGPTPKRPKKRRKGSRRRVFTASGLEVTMQKIGSPENTGTGGGRKKHVPTATAKSSHNRKARRRYSSCSLLQ